MATQHDKPHLTGKEGGPIDLDVAASWTKAHREKHPDHAHSHFFGKEAIQKLLAQEGCMGIRVYHGYNEKGEKKVVLVGTNKEGNDQLNVASSDTAMAPHVALDQTVDCPGDPRCKGSLLTD